jgi:urease accessory protein
MTWHASLQLDYKRDASSAASRTVAHFRHDGPLRILQSLYPEGDAICHNVLVHPPGGLVGGDTLDIRVSVGENAHGLVTTPGATRFYRSDADLAVQRVRVDMASGSRLEWLPLEALAYNDCKALNQATFKLAPGAELIGWDVTAFGLPHAQQPYLRGRFQQHLEIPGVWLERGRVDATDASLMDGPLGMAGHRCLATLFFATGTALTRERREIALDAARHVMDMHGLRDTAGATSPHDQVIAVRVLAPVVEPAMDLLRQVWRAWRRELWQLGGEQPRIWST